MFLIRTAFWLTLLILLLPTSEEQQRQVYGTAATAVKDLSGFCDRNPYACETGKEALETFGQKARFGANMLMDFIKDPSGSQTAEAPRSEGHLRLPSVFRQESRSTLTGDDLKPAWSAPSGRPGV